jgi:hypothetical protein
VKRKKEAAMINFQQRNKNTKKIVIAGRGGSQLFCIFLLSVLGDLEPNPDDE